MLELADQALFLSHGLLILFNMTGWAWRATRVWHLVTLGLTTLSWFVLGAFYGWGYCICADWHFQIRRAMGIHDPDFSYIQLMLRCQFGLPVSLETANLLAGITYLLILIATAVTWARVLQGRRLRDKP